MWLDFSENFWFFLLGFVYRHQCIIEELCHQSSLSSLLQEVFYWGLQLFWSFFFSSISSSSFRKFLCYISRWLLTIFWYVYRWLQKGFWADSWNVLSTFVICLLGWYLLLVLLRCSFFRSLHLLFVMLFMIVCLLTSFWFYLFDIDIFLVSVGSLWAFLSFYALTFIEFL